MTEDGSATSAGPNEHDFDMETIGESVAEERERARANVDIDWENIPNFGSMTPEHIRDYLSVLHIMMNRQYQVGTEIAKKISQMEGNTGFQEHIARLYNPEPLPPEVTPEA